MNDAGVDALPEDWETLYGILDEQVLHARTSLMETMPGRLPSTRYLTQKIVEADVGTEKWKLLSLGYQMVVVSAILDHLALPRPRAGSPIGGTTKRRGK